MLKEKHESEQQGSESKRALLCDEHDSSHQSRVEGQIRRCGFGINCWPVIGMGFSVALGFGFDAVIAGDGNAPFL
jgi:hypothetical protein